VPVPFIRTGAAFELMCMCGRFTLFLIKTLSLSHIWSTTLIYLNCSYLLYTKQACNSQRELSITIIIWMALAQLDPQLFKQIIWAL